MGTKAREVSKSNRADPEDRFETHVSFVDNGEACQCVATNFLQRCYELIGSGATWRGEGILSQAQDLQPKVTPNGLDVTGPETITRLRNVLPGVGISALTLLNSKDYGRRRWPLTRMISS